MWKVFKCGVIFGPNTRKYLPEITPYLDTFHAMLFPGNRMFIENVSMGFKHKLQFWEFTAIIKYFVTHPKSVEAAKKTIMLIF